MTGTIILGPEEVAIARSVLYAAIFEYPLTLAQLRQTLELPLTPSRILAAYERSKALQAIVEHRQGFFFPRGRDEFVSERHRREARSRAFLRANRLLLRCIGAMPYVRMVALSGSIAHLNLDHDGDLDLFIVTRGRHAWSVTVAVVLLAKIMRRRRAVCANYTVADSCLAFEQQDLFTASQVIHLKPLIGREVYDALLAENRFVYRFYPNFHHSGSGSLARRRSAAVEGMKTTIETLLTVPAAIAELLCRTAYGWHLRRRAPLWRSPEQVSLRPDSLKLHTQSHRQSVFDRFERSVEEALREAERAVVRGRARA